MAISVSLNHPGMVIAQTHLQWTVLSGGGGLPRLSCEETAMEMESLQDLFVHDLKDLYNAEIQLTKALPKMAKAANEPALKQAFQTHLKETEGHVERLEQIFEELDESPKGKKCKAMEGLIEEGKELME